MGFVEDDKKKPDIHVNLRTVLSDLVSDGRVNPDDADHMSLKIRPSPRADLRRSRRGSPGP